MKVAVVATGSPHPWDDAAVFCSRFIGALAVAADVDVLVASGQAPSHTTEGAAERYTFPTPPVDRVRQQALEMLAYGPVRDPWSVECDCFTPVYQQLADSLPLDVQHELAWLSGPAAPGLVEHLRSAAYDLVVFLGYSSAMTSTGLGALPDGTPTLLLPLASRSPALYLGAFDEVFERVGGIITASDAEQQLVAERAPGRVDAIHTVGSVVRVHDHALRNVPLLYEPVPTVVVPRDWQHTPDPEPLVRTVRRLNRDLGDRGVVRLIGPGWQRLPDDVRAPHADSRFDTWRWTVRAKALWDPQPGRLLGREAIEALQYGTPIIASADGGATAEHARLGDAGLWYRSYEELLGAVELLFADAGIRDALGRQGQEYAMQRYGDTDGFIKEVRSIVDRVTSEG